MYSSIHMNIWVLYTFVGQTIGMNSTFNNTVFKERLRWVDHVETDPHDMDMFMDRIVFVIIKRNRTDGIENYLGEYQALAPAVLIEPDRLLSSHVPFKPYLQIRGRYRSENFPSLVYINQRTIIDWKKVKYHLLYRNIMCARRIVPEIHTTPWHRDRQHSPVHDLTVFRTRYPVPLHHDWISLDWSHRYQFSNYWGESWVQLWTGPLLTPLAEPDEFLGGKIKFVSLGFRDDLHIWRSAHLYTADIEEEEYAQENCEEWINRDWGHFICIRNVHGFEGLGSGAMLFHNDKLFGVGSFLLQKGKKGVLAFTDIRKYHHLIQKTCTDEDLDVNHDKCCPNMFKG